MKCIILTVKSMETFDNVKSVTLPAFSGQMQLLHKQVESFIELVKGNIKIEFSKGNQIRSINRGICHTKNDIITILAF